MSLVSSRCVWEVQYQRGGRAALRPPEAEGGVNAELQMQSKGGEGGAKNHADGMGSLRFSITTGNRKSYRIVTIVQR